MQVLGKLGQHRVFDLPDRRSCWFAAHRRDVLCARAECAIVATAFGFGGFAFSTTTSGPVAAGPVRANSPCRTHVVMMPQHRLGRRIRLCILMFGLKWLVLSDSPRVVCENFRCRASGPGGRVVESQPPCPTLTVCTRSVGWSPGELVAVGNWSDSPSRGAPHSDSLECC